MTATVKELSVANIEPYQKWFSALLDRLGIIDLNALLFENNKDIESEDDDDGDAYLMSLDPKEWKQQDHYAVFGLKKKRFHTTENELKKAYRKKVLIHHPDKRHPGVELDLDHDYYSCITKAYEILGDPIKRRSYDSIDPTFDNEIPSVSQHSKSHFYEVFTPVFKLNSRWSVKGPVPELGDHRSSFEQVNRFYSFWYDYDSWREYSYLDEEEKEKGENREERRWMEKQNKAARAQRKKEEMQRIRQLVDNAYACDPRIAKFKEEERMKKVNQKKAKQDAIKARQMEEEKIRKDAEEKERKIKEVEKEKEKAAKDEEKKKKEAIKKKKQKERKQLKSELDKLNFLSINDGAEQVERLKQFDMLCNTLSLEELVKFNKDFDGLVDENAKIELFLEEVRKLNNKIDDERTASLNPTSAQDGQNDSAGTKKVWSYDDVQLLVKAVKLFPAGTKDRWAVVAKFINDKSSSGIKRDHRDVLSRAKEMQNSAQSKLLKEETNKNAFKSLKESVANPGSNESVPTQRTETPSTFVELNSQPWTAEEQQLFEQALKTYPSSHGSERWDLISECLPLRSRSDCIQRFKYLHELVKSKNAAKTAIHTSKLKKN